MDFVEFVEVVHEKTEWVQYRDIAIQIIIVIILLLTLLIDTLRVLYIHWETLEILLIRALVKFLGQ